MERQAAVEQIGLHPLGGQASTARSRRRRPVPGAPARRPNPSPHATARHPAAAASGHRVSTGAPRPRRRSGSSTAPSRTPGRPSVRRNGARPRVWPYKVTAPDVGSSWTFVSTCLDMAVHLDSTDALGDEESLLGRDRAGVRRTRCQADGARRRTRQRYPEAWIEQMKRIGIYGLAVPEEYGGSPVSMPCYVLVTAGAGPRLDEPGRGDGRAHRRRQTAAPVRHRGTEAALPAADGHRRTARHHGADRTGRRLRPAEHDHHRAPRRRRPGDQRLQDVDLQRAAFRPDRAAVQDRPRRHAQAPGHLDRPRRARARA